jgi:limonene-1,2-epoxide hydrolase
VTAEEIVDAFTARITALDFDGAFELVADDIEYDNVPIGKVEGPDGIRGVFATLDGMGVDAMEWTVHRQVASDTTVLNERTDKFGVKGKWAGVDVAGIFEVRDGKIVLWRDYFDMNAMTAAITELTS